jgi:hypothetical protein
MKIGIFRVASIILAGALALSASPVFASSTTFTGGLNQITKIASTVPQNGDINPYGVAVVPRSLGNLVKGDILVSNFNNSDNLQGTGTTIVEISPQGKLAVFASLDASKLPGACPGGVGLTTALAVLRNGFVIVGSLPTKDGSAATAQAGCLIVLNAWGKAVETISGRLINGPWDMTSFEYGKYAALFVTNVLDGTVAASPNVVKKGNVARIVLSFDKHHNPKVVSRTLIASGFGQRTDPDALVIGPTGVGLAKNGILYVADALDNRITAIPNALYRHDDDGIGHIISSGKALNTPLGLAIAPNGNILAANGGDGNLVEVTPGGEQAVVKMIDTTGTGGGTLFGLAVTPGKNGLYFVNDGDNTLQLLH